MSGAATFCLNRPMAALYRKYRPQSFDEVVGQEAVVRTLTQRDRDGRGAAGLPLRRRRAAPARPRWRASSPSASTARRAPTTTPDGTCHACRAITAGTSLDVIEMDAASQRGIDDIREIRDRVVLQPVEGRYKVYILDEAHQLTTPRGTRS